MMTVVHRIWISLGSMRLTYYLLACITCLFFMGSIFYGINSKIFVFLNSAMLFEWLGTFGLENLRHTWWFFLLLGALFLLGVNTSICTIERMVRIIRLRNRRSIKNMLFLLAPHIMHLAFLIIIVGYFVLYTFGVNSYNNIMKPGLRRCLPGSSVVMELRDPSFSTVRHQHNDSLNGLYVAATYTLLFHDGDKTDMRRIGLNSPCIYRGYSIHVVDFNPQRTNAMTSGVWVNLTIKKNMGIPLFMVGIISFAIGVFLYALSAYNDSQ